MARPRSYFITGGAGFIGSNLVDTIFDTEPDARVTVYDALTYAGRRENLARHEDDNRFGRFSFVEGDVCDRERVFDVLCKCRPDVVFHLAAESHVDRSIDGPEAFMRTNIMGTFAMLEAAHAYWVFPGHQRPDFRFVHVSTDEVFGSLGSDEAKFDLATPYDPRSPYAASKAASDHLARAWFHTYDLPVIVTNCSNNYGPRQHPEKLLPKMILNALDEKRLPVYGDGSNIRDWLHVSDHCRGLLLAAQRGEPGDTFLFGGHGEKSNIEVVMALCDRLDFRQPREVAFNPGAALGQKPSYRSLVEFVEDRPGHDYRYAVDPATAEVLLDWKPRVSFEQGLAQTVDWYMDNRAWCERAVNPGDERLGLGLVVELPGRGESR